MPSSPSRARRPANDEPAIDATIITELSIGGLLPVALSGRYLRVSPNRIDAVSLDAGSAAAYESRRITTDADVAVINVVAFGSSILAFGDGAPAYELSVGLDTLRRVDLGGARRRLTAHPTIDAITGALHLLTSDADRAQLHVTVSPGGLRRTIRSIDNAPTRIQQLALTRDHIVLLADGYVGVADRSSVNSTATWVAVDTDTRCIATAYEQDETVIVCVTGPSLERWTLNRTAATAHCEILDAAPHSFACSNTRLSGAAHRFLWTIGTGGVHKHDLLTGTRLSRDLDGGRNRGELVFVADADRSSTEDGGWLVGFVHDASHNEADFVVLDAQQIDRPAIAVAHIPHGMPEAARGTWIPAISAI